MAILGQAQATFVDLTNPIRLESILEVDRSRIQFYSSNGVYTPSYSVSSPVTIKPFVRNVIDGEINLSTNNSVKSIRWFYRLGAQDVWTEIASNNTYFNIVEENQKKIALKIIGNIMNKSASSLEIKCEIGYKESWMPETFIEICTTEFYLNIQGESGEDAYTVVLTNETHSIVCDSDGVPKSGEIGSNGRAKTTVIVYKGGKILSPTNSASPGSGQYKVNSKNLDTGILFVKESDNKTFYLDNASSSSKIPESGKATLEVLCEGTSHKIDKEFTFSKVKDGFVGADALVVALTNDTHTIPTDSEGNGGNYTGCDTTILLYQGSTLLSSGVTYSATKSSNITGNLVANKYTVTNLSGDTGYVDMKATYKGYDYIRRFTVAKSKGGGIGQNATAYWMIVSASAINFAEGKYTPSTITASARSQSGESAPVDYACRFKIEESTNGTTWTVKYTSSSDETSKIYTPSAPNLNAIRCTMYKSGGVTNKLDEQLVPVTKDGAKAMAIDITGDQIFSYDDDNNVSPTSITLKATAKNFVASGSNIQWQYHDGSWKNLSLGTSMNILPTDSMWSGSFLRIKAYYTLEPTIFDEFTLYKVRDGKNNMVVDIFAPKGTIIKNHDKNSLPLEASIYWGGNDVSTEGGARYKWEKQNANGSWTVIRDYTSGSSGRGITVTADDIPNMLHVRALCEYKGMTMKKSISLQDITDPYQITTTSTAGYNFKNGEIDTHVICNITQNATDLNIINMYTNLPSTSQFTEGAIVYITTNDKYYELKNNSWTALEEAPSIENQKSEYNYTWYKLARENLLKSTFFASGKIVRITNKDVDQVANFRVIVEDAS